MQELVNWLIGLEWNRLIPEILGKGIGFLLGFAASWYMLFRRRLQEIRKLQRGETDDVIFQTHHLIPLEGTGDKIALIFRNVGPRTTLYSLYDNPAARDLAKELSDKTSLKDPIIQTEGTMGFEILNDALGHIAGLLANNPFDREEWLFTMTCEDRQIVRKKCIRCFLIRPADLERFLDWHWCTQQVHVERTWHAFRIVALHQVARVWRQEQGWAQSERAGGAQGAKLEMPLVSKRARYERVRPISVGVFRGEKPVGSPQAVDWKHFANDLKQMGLELPEPEEP